MDGVMEGYLDSDPRGGDQMVKRLSKIAPILFVALLTGCVAVQPVSREAVLRIGITPDYPPLIFKIGEEIKGAEAEFGNLLAKELQRKPEYIELFWEEQIPALIGGKIDIIMSGMSITDARKVRVDFTEPYMKSGLMALMRAEDAPGYPTLESIKQSLTNVGVVKGTTGEVFVRKNFTQAQVIIPLIKASDSVYPIKNRKIDLFIHDAPSIAWLVSENEADLKGFWEPFNEEYLAWAVNRGDRDLLSRVNETIRKWKNDGTMRDVLKRWLPYLNQYN
jgi:ABC-type amino acid transport substrate-binding protein